MTARQRAGTVSLLVHAACGIASGERTIVTLSEPLPVHIVYLTHWVNKDGSVHFRNDVYQRDAALAKALLGARAGMLR